MLFGKTGNRTRFKKEKKGAKINQKPFKNDEKYEKIKHTVAPTSHATWPQPCVLPSGRHKNMPFTAKKRTQETDAKNTGPQNERPWSKPKSTA